MEDSKLPDKIPFLRYIIALSVIGGILYKISKYELEDKTFPVEHFFWGLIVAGILLILSKITIDTKVQKIISYFLIPVFLLCFCIAALSLVYNQFLAPIFNQNVEVTVKHNENELAIENLKTSKRKITFDYKYDYDDSATLSGQISSLDEETEYSLLVAGRALRQGKNKVSIDFENLSWNYLNNEEIAVKIRLILSIKGGDEEEIEILSYEEIEGKPHTEKWHPSPHENRSLSYLR